MDYTPHGAQAEILAKAMSHIQSVPYRVSARWLFYRLLQDGTYPAKGDYKNKFLPLLTRARKAFYQDWQPDTLADDTRQTVYRGFGYRDGPDWLLSGIYRQGCKLDKWREQTHYVELWFEAEAMREQFAYHTTHITLRPFRGDPSLDFKWTIAKHLEDVAAAYGAISIVILYFGDLDPKGLQIPESAAEDIKDWSRVSFEFVRCGLNPGDEVRFGLPENPDKPGEYQWEALTDDDARGLIRGNIERYVDEEAVNAVIEQEAEITERFQQEIEAIAERWQED